MKKHFALLALFGALALVGCGKPKAAAPAPKVEKTAAAEVPALGCPRPVFRTSFAPIKEVTLEELAAGGAKQMRLTRLERYTTLELIKNSESRRGAVHFSSQISPKATAEKLDSQININCYDMSQLPTKALTESARAPLLVDLSPQTLGAISSDVKLWVKVLGVEHVEYRKDGYSSITSEALLQPPTWLAFTDSLAKQLDQYALYEVDAGRVGMFSEKQFRSSKVLPEEQVTQTSVFDTLTYMEYTIE